MTKNGIKKGLPALPPQQFLMFILLIMIRNRTVFLVQHGNNCTCEFLKKLKLHLQKWLVQSFNMELICACEFLKKPKMHLRKRLVQFQLLQKLTDANKFQIKLETIWLSVQQH